MKGARAAIRRCHGRKLWINMQTGMACAVHTGPEVAAAGSAARRRSGPAARAGAWAER